MTLHEDICARLDELGINFRQLHHEAVTSSAEAAAVRGVELNTGAKAMVVKAKDRYMVFVIPADRHLDWKAVKLHLGSKSARFASEEELRSVTGLVKGSVPPFGNLLGLPVLVDRELVDQPLIRFNAGSLTDSIEMPGSRLAEATDAELGWFAD